MVNASVSNPVGLRPSTFTGYADDDDSFNPRGSGHSPLKRPTFLACILPPGSFFLLVLLLLLTPLALLTGESLVLPFIDWVRSWFVSNPDNTFTVLPLPLLIKLVVFLILSFLGWGILLLRIKTLYVSTWSQTLPRPHALHSQYHPEPIQSVIALINWSGYRMVNTIMPPLLMLMVTLLVGIAEIYLFNLFSILPVITFPIQFIVGIFVLLLLGLFSTLSVIGSVWKSVKTVFGSIAAITEPDLPSKLILERCSRIAFCAPQVVLLYPVYAVFLLALAGEVYWLLSAIDIQDVLAGKFNWGFTLGMESLTLLAYGMIVWLTLATYHAALGRYYRNLPQSVKERYKALSL
jgi:hypothetical protein